MTNVEARHEPELILDDSEPTGEATQAALTVFNSVDIGPVAVVNLLTSHWMGPTSWLLPRLEILPVTYQALQEVHLGYPAHLVKLAVHTDGATSDGPASWANILIGTDSEGAEWFLGSYAAQVVAVPGPGWLGATRHTSSAAELSGVTWALQVVLQHATQIEAAEIWYDSKYASGIAQAFFNPSAHSELAVVAAGLNLPAQQLCGLTWHYEAGHKGNPWNEAADVMAKFTCRDNTQSFTGVSPCTSWIGDGSVFAKWAFLHRPSASQIREYPPMCVAPPLNDSSSSHGMHLFLSIVGHTTPHQFLPVDVVAAKFDSFVQADVSDTGDSVVSHNLTFLHYNVQTMRGPVKQKYFAKQLRNHSVMFATCPESRFRHTDLQMLHGYIVASSACSKGGYSGCSVWICPSIPTSTVDGIEQFVALEDVSVLIAEPRRLLVQVCSTGLSCIIACLHGLDSGGYSQCQIASWWSSTRDICSPIVGARDTFLCGVDGNLRVTENVDEVIGDCLDAQPTGVDQMHLVGLCSDLHLFVANTFPSLVKTDSQLGTWHLPPPSIGTARCDYILTSVPVIVAPQSCFTMPEFMDGSHGHDHIPLRLVLSVTSARRHPVSLRRVATYDRRAVAAAAESLDPGIALKIARIENTLAARQPIGFAFDSTSHIHTADALLLGAVELEFPKVQSAPKDQWITGKTMQVFSRRSSQWKLVSKLGSQVRAAAFRYTFKFWASQLRTVKWTGQLTKLHPVPTFFPCSGFVNRQLLVKRRLASVELMLLHKEYAVARCNDYMAFAAGKAEQLVDASLNRDVRTTSHLLRAMKPYQPKRTCRLLDLDGLPASSYVQAQLVKQSHFAAVLKGTPVLMGQIVADSRAMLEAKAIRHADVARSIVAVPSLQYGVGKNATAKRFKAISESTLGSEIHHLMPSSVARLYHPAHVKASLRVELPIQWAGGLLAALWKGKGNPSDIANSRDVTVVSSDANQFAAHTRSGLYSPLQKLAGLEQHGSGLNGGACDLAHLHISQGLVFAMRKNKSSAVVFLDIAAAFASLMRCVAIPSDAAADTEWRDYLLQLGFANDEANAVLALACDTLRWASVGSEPHFIALLQEAHASTWFSIEGIRTVVRYFGGVPAGTSLADLFFCAGCSRVITCFRCELLQKNLLFHSGIDQVELDSFWGGPQLELQPELFQMSAFMDDLAVPLIADTPSRILPMVQTTCEVAHSVSTKFSFLLNFAIGKTHAIVRIVGAGADPVRQQLLNDHFAVHFSSGGLQFEVPIVDAYQHLVRLLVVDVNLKPDILARSNQAATALSPIAHRYFRQPQVKIEQKIQVARAHLFSILCVGASGWHTMRPAERKLFHGKVFRTWRSTTAAHFSERIAAGLAPLSDQELLDTYQLIAPQTLVTLARLNLFIRVITKGTDSLRRALFAAREAEWSWLHAVQADFGWIRAHSTEFDSVANLQQWIVNIRLRPFFWRGLIKQIAATKAANQILPFQSNPKPNASIALVGLQIVCSECGEVLPNSSAKTIHEFRQHGVRNPARLYILADNSCRYCSKFFPTRHHCARHLSEYTEEGTCLAAMQCCLPPLDPAESLRLDLLDVEVKKEHFAVKKNARGGRSKAVGPNVLDFRPYFLQMPVAMDRDG